MTVGRGGGGGIWISKKKWQALEKRVDDLEGQIQSQLINFAPKFLIDGITANSDCDDLIKKHNEILKRYFAGSIDYCCIFWQNTAIISIKTCGVWNFIDFTIRSNHRKGVEGDEATEGPGQIQ